MGVTSSCLSTAGIGRAACAVFALLVMLTSTAPPAAASGCDLYASSSSCTFGAATFYATNPQPTGTGVIDSFLRIQANGTEQGFNTGARPLEAGIEDKVDPNFTRNLPLSAVPIVDGHRRFFLDINEEGAPWGEKLTLDQLKIFVSNTPNLNDYSAAGGGTMTGATKIYDLDTLVADNWVNLSYNLFKGGSGKGDMVVSISDAGFTGQYLYLYSQFGCAPSIKGSCGSGTTMKYASGGGFEEWWTLAPVSASVPEPATLLLVAPVLAGMRRFRRIGANL
jgi:hypothetical protein